MSDVLKFTDKLEARKTQHYILNYQYTRNDRILRAEVYHKTYRNLVTYAAAFPDFSTAFCKWREGYARGLDVFYRDNQSFKNVDYWVSYSFLDSERNYQNYPSKPHLPLQTHII